MVERRKYSPEFKARAVLELLSGQKSLAQASREYGIKDTVLSRWKQEFLERAPELFERAQSDKSQEAARIAELERMVGRLTMQLDVAKKYSDPRASHPRKTGARERSGGVVWLFGGGGV